MGSAVAATIFVAVVIAAAEENPIAQREGKLYGKVTVALERGKVEGRRWKAELLGIDRMGRVAHYSSYLGYESETRVVAVVAGSRGACSPVEARTLGCRRDVWRGLALRPVMKDTAVAGLGMPDAK